MNSFSKATPKERAQYLLQRWQTLKEERAPFYNKWKEVSQLVSQWSGRFDGDDFDKLRSEKLILDSSPRYYLDILANGMFSNSSPSSRAWFRIETNDTSLNQNHAVNAYCDLVYKSLLKVFSISNTYQTLQSMFKELALFGVSASIVYDDSDTLLRHHLLTAGEYCLSCDNNGDVDTLYRNFYLNVIQAVKAFGYENCPEQIKRLYDEGYLHQRFEFIHAIEPRIDRDLNAKDNKNMPYASYYMCLADNVNTIISESGFDEFPVICPRWEVLGGRVYGNSPCISALPDIKQLYIETLRKTELIEQYTKPPLQAPINSRQNPISLRAGAVNYIMNTGAENNIKPIVNSSGDLSALMADIESINARIRQQLFYDLFMRVSQGADSSRRTTVEIYAIQNEQMQALGSVVERNQNEMLGKLVNIAFNKLIKSGMLPPAPPELAESGVKAEFTSVLAQSQKSVDINSVDRFISAISAVSQIKPEVLDRLDADGYIDEYRDRLGVAPKIIKSKEDADKIREQRAMAEQQQMQMQQDSVDANNAAMLAQAQKSGSDASLATQQLDEVGGGSLY